MTFTFGADLTVDRDFVRFHTGDTVEAQAYLTDELIASLISVEGSKEAAVIAALNYIITRLSQPNFTADWLTVDLRSARAGYRDLLNSKYGELGITRFTASVVHVYRADSTATEEPDYSEGI